MSRIALGLAALAVLAGCSPAPTVEPPPTAAATRSAPSSPTTPLPAPTVTDTRTAEPASSETVVPTPSASSRTVAAPPSEPPPPPTAPAPATAGGLSETDVATADGWHPTAKPGGSEEGFMGNGTWVHATSAEHSAYAAMALGCAELSTYPQPVAALEGNLSDDAGRPGVGLTLEFANAADAGAYFAEWVRQAEACVGTATQQVSASSHTWVGRRNLGTVWSETVGVRGDTVRFLIVDSPDADLSGALDGAP